MDLEEGAEGDALHRAREALGAEEEEEERRREEQDVHLDRDRQAVDDAPCDYGVRV